MTLAVQLQQHVETVLGKSGAAKHLNKRIEEFLAQNGNAPKDGDVAALAEFSTGYVRAVVDLLVACDHAAMQAGVTQFSTPILQLAAGYFLQPKDFIPDKKGAYGLLDDAYLACRFVARLSELVAQSRGVPLLDTALDSQSPVVRVLIGEPLATQLDSEIESTLTQVLAQIQVAQLSPWQVAPGGWNQWVQRQNEINTNAEIMRIGSGMF